MSHVVWNAKHATFRVGNVVTPGLLRPLRCVFYSTYSMPRNGIAQQPRKRNASHFDPFSADTTVARSMTTGRSVDFIVGHTIHLRAQHNLPHDVFFSKQRCDALIAANAVPPASIEPLRKFWSRKRGPLAYVIKFWVCMHAENLSPVHSELPVGCLQLRLATRIDVVCQHVKTGAWVIVELKSGFHSHYETHRGMLSTPIAHIPSCLHTHHQLQLLLEVELFQRTYPLRHVSDAFVLHFHDDGYTRWPLNSEISSARASILLALQQRHHHHVANE